MRFEALSSKLSVKALSVSLVSGATLLVSTLIEGQEPGKTSPTIQAPAPAPAAAPAKVQAAVAAPGAQPGVAKPPAAGTASAERRVYRPLPPPDNFSPPILHVDQPDYDWGSTIQGEVVKHNFVLMNKGGSPLTVMQVKASCGCTTVAKPEKPIPPGQTGIVTLEIDTKKFPGGPVKKTADILSNAGSTPLRVSMGGKVDTVFVLEPPTPKIDVVRGIEPVPAKVTLRRNAQLAFTLKEVKTQSKVLQPAFEEIEAGNVYSIFLKPVLGPTDTRAYYYEQVDVKLDAAGKELDIPIRVQIAVKDRIDIQPRNSVYFSRTEVKPLRDGQVETVSKSVEIKSLGGPDHNFKITQVDAPKQGFEAKLETVAEGKHYRLLVVLPRTAADDKTRTLREKIVLHTDDPTVKELTINTIAALQ
jgi:hypothetical protein